MEAKNVGDHYWIVWSVPIYVANNLPNKVICKLHHHYLHVWSSLLVDLSPTCAYPPTPHFEDHRVEKNALGRHRPSLPASWSWTSLLDLSS
jgi:hypothetical protein